MNLQELIGQIVRVKDRRVVGKKHFALLIAVSRDGSIGYLRLTQNGSKIERRDYEIKPTAFGLDWPIDRSPRIRTNDKFSQNISP